MASKKNENKTLKELENSRESLKGTIKGISIVWILITLIYIAYISNRMLNYDDSISRFLPMLIVWILGTAIIIILPRTELKKIEEEIIRRQKL